MSRPRHLLLRGDLQRAIAARIARLGLTQSRVAARLGVSQPRVNALLRGRIDLFSLDALADLAAPLGIRLTLRAPRPRAAGRRRRASRRKSARARRRR